MIGLYKGRELHFIIPFLVMTILHLPYSVMYCARTSSSSTSLLMVFANLNEMIDDTNGSFLSNTISLPLVTSSYDIRWSSYNFFSFLITTIYFPLRGSQIYFPLHSGTDMLYLPR